MFSGTIEQDLAEEGLEEQMDSIADYLYPKLNEQGLNIASTIFATRIADKTANRRQTHNELQNKINILLGDIRLFEKGLKLLPSDLQNQLTKYLLKTLCTDVINEILNYIAAEQNSNITTDNFSNDQRMKFVNELPLEYKKPLVPLLKSLLGQSVDDFMKLIEDGLSACSMILKKIDKKKDRIVVLNHKYQLLEELNKCEDLALSLHLAVLVIFTTATQSMLHISGRHVAGVLSFLKSYLLEEQAIELTSYYGELLFLVLNSIFLCYCTYR